MSGKYRIQDLPVQLDLQEAVVYNRAPYITMVVGAVILVLCAGLMFWGPDQVVYNAEQGMNLWQVILANPGAFALIGGATINLGSVWLKQRGKKLERLVWQQMAFSKEQLPAGKKLAVTGGEHGLFRVQLATGKA